MWMKYTCLALLALLCASRTVAQTTLHQRLVVTENAKTTGGAFAVGLYVSGTNLPSGNTVGSMTIDIVYNTDALQFVNATMWGLSPLDGYTMTLSPDAIPNTIRVGALGTSVNWSGGGSPAGFDITAAEKLVVQLNFTIKNMAAHANLSINSGSNQIGFFLNHSNNPAVGIINDQLLSTPVVIQDETLPVELAAFNASSGSGTVKLSWKTATETANHGFEIERRIAASGSGENAWTTLGFVPGAGTSNAAHEYAYTDKTPSAGTVTYRLKQIDRDGSYAYSDQIEVRVEAPAAYALAQNYPNPFNPSTTIYFETPKDGDVAIELFNVLGEKVADVVRAFYPGGRHAVTFRADALSSGVYFYRLAVNGVSFTKTMHLLK